MSGNEGNGGYIVNALRQAQPDRTSVVAITRITDDTLLNEVQRLRALVRQMQETAAFAVRMPDGTWVGIWNDRTVAERVANRGTKYEVVAFPLTAAQPEGADSLPPGPNGVANAVGTTRPAGVTSEMARRIESVLAYMPPEEGTDGLIERLIDAGVLRVFNEDDANLYYSLTARADEWPRGWHLNPVCALAAALVKP